MNARERDEAFTAFVEARRGGLRRLAYGLCGDWHRADDLVQTALVKAYLAWPRVHAGGAEDAYVRRILVNSHVDDTRRPWFRRERSGLEGRDRPVDPAPVEERNALVEALQQLPAMQRAVVVLRYLEDLSVEETAAELGIGPGTVKSHASRGRERLRALLVPADATGATGATGPTGAGDVP